MRGILKTNDKGLLVTTGKFSSGAEEFVEEDPSRPIVLIDGVRLLQLCIDQRLGFRFSPVFDLALLHEQARAVTSKRPDKASVHPGRSFVKTVTSNDIRARIVSLPAELAVMIPREARTVSVSFPPRFPAREYQYNHGRKYIAGVTDVLRAFGLLTSADERIPHVTEWFYEPIC